MRGRPGLPPGTLPSKYVQHPNSKPKASTKPERADVSGESDLMQIGVPNLATSSPSPQQAEMSAFDKINATLASNDELVRVLRAQALDRTASLKQMKRSSSLNTTPRTDAVLKEASAAATPRLSNFSSQSTPSVSDFQERLSARLAPLAHAAKLVSQMVENRKGLGGAVLKLTCKNFVVGRASCFNSSVLDVCVDRFEYNFNHAQQGKIHMVMYFKDIDRASLDIKRLTFVFHIAGPMKAVFAGAYDHKNKAHQLSWVFFTAADAAAFQKQISAAALPVAALEDTHA